MQPEFARCLPGSRDGMLWRGCRRRGRVITVVDVDAARRALTAGELACPRPGCAGILRIWSAARSRRVRGLGGTVVTLTPDRARCRSCKATTTLLPAWCLPRRGYTVEVVGAVLLAAAEGAGYRRAAAGVGAAAGTVRGWLHAARAGAAALTARVSGVVEAAGAGRYPSQVPPVWQGRALPEAVAALGAAARAFVLALATPADPARAVGSAGSTIWRSWLNATACTCTASRVWSTPPARWPPCPLPPPPGRLIPPAIPGPRTPNPATRCTPATRPAAPWRVRGARVTVHTKPSWCQPSPGPSCSPRRRRVHRTRRDPPHPAWRSTPGLAWR